MPKKKRLPKPGAIKRLEKQIGKELKQIPLGDIMNSFG